MRNTTGTLIIYHVMHRGDILSHHVTFLTDKDTVLSVAQHGEIASNDHAVLCDDMDLHYIGKVPASFERYVYLTTMGSANRACPLCTKQTERMDNE